MVARPSANGRHPVVRIPDLASLLAGPLVPAGLGVAPAAGPNRRDRRNFARAGRHRPPRLRGDPVECDRVVDAGRLSRSSVLRRGSAGGALCQALWMVRPNVLVTRPIMDEPLSRLRERCDVTVSDNGFGIPREELLRIVAGRDALITMLTERVDAEFLEAAGFKLQI